MNHLDKLVLAFAAGAAAAFRPNRMRENLIKKPMNDAYADLVTYAKETHPNINFDILNHAPGQGERQQILRNAIAEAGADKDKALLAKAEHLLSQITLFEQEAILAAQPTDE